MTIYLDNSATTCVTKEAAETALSYMRDQFYNPSSLYAPAVECEKAVNAVRMRIAAGLGANADELIFTSGGTESNNLAILGSSAALKSGNWRLITTAIEHSSVFGVFEALRAAGQEVMYVRTDSHGYVDMQHLSSLLNERTALVSIMHVNNEFGTVQNLAEIRALVNRISPAALLHSDGVQAFTKLPLSVVPCDLYSISGHKFHAPKGVGALLMRRGVKSGGGLIGGGQENGRRSGTTNTSGIMAMGTAFIQAASNQQARAIHMQSLKLRLAQGLSVIPDIAINGPALEQGAPHILNISFMGVRGEVLVHALEQRGVLVGTGSACSSHKKGPNRVLAAIGVTDARAEGAIRFSLCPYNTVEEIDYTSQIVSETVPFLRRYSRR